MRPSILFAIVFSSFILLGCGGSSSGVNDNSDSESPESNAPELPAPPRAVTWDELTDGNLQENDSIILEGFIGPLPKFLSVGGASQEVNIYPRRNQVAGYHVSAKVATGTGRNQMAPLPMSFSQEDLYLYTNEGTSLRVGDYARLTGTYMAASNVGSTGQPFASVQISKVEVDSMPFDEAQLEAAVELTDSIIEDSTQVGVYAYVDASLGLGMFMGGFMDDRYNIIIRQSNNSYLNTASIAIGERPNSMEKLQDNFTEDDFILRDLNGEVHRGARGKYRIYGNYQRLPSSSSEKGFLVDFEIEEIKKL